jgi:RNA polymerase sigma factor (sigma-70 family)
MSRPLPNPPMDEPPTPEYRQRYEALLAQAMRYAERLVPADQAFEVAHDVAVDLSRRTEDVNGTLVYLAITYRLRTVWRTSDRRAATERAYLDQRAGALPAWAQPDAGLLAGELGDRIDETLARMPKGMREAFLLVRDDGLSYREAASRLGVSAGTIHTQISRANALLRECVQAYDADRPPSKNASTGRSV